MFSGFLKEVFNGRRKIHTITTKMVWSPESIAYNIYIFGDGHSSYKGQKFKYRMNKSHCRVNANTVL